MIADNFAIYTKFFLLNIDAALEKARNVSKVLKTSFLY